MEQPKKKKQAGPAYDLKLPFGQRIRGYLVEHAVWVYEKEDIEILDSHGAFGKGLLSRGKPDFHTRVQKGEIGHEADRPFQRARPYLKPRRSRKSGKAAASIPAVSSSSSSASEPQPIPVGAPAAADEAMDIDNDKKRKRDEAETAPVGSSAALPSDFIDPEALSLEEPVQLMFEEAFFLNYVIECLEVTRPDNSPVSTLELWQYFTATQPNFINTYVAYHYYRSLGWVPKPGSKMGVDLAIYHLGPRYTHAPFGILIIPVDCQNKTEVHANPDAFLHLRWHKLGALFRVIHGAAKELMCAFVVQPPPTVSLSSPDCLQHFSIQELIVDRWVPKEDRDAVAETEMD